MITPFREISNDAGAEDVQVNRVERWYQIPFE